MLLTDNELTKIVGGGLTAAFLNSVSRYINMVLDLGRTVGTSIRYAVSGKRC